MIFSSILMIFWSLLNFGSIVAQKLNRFICKIFFWIFWHQGHSCEIRAQSDTVKSEHSCDYYLSFSHSSQSWVKWAHQSHRKIQPYVFVTKNRKTIFVMTLKNYAWFFWCCLCTEHDNAWSCCLQQKAPSLKGGKWYISLNRWAILFVSQSQ